MTRTARAIGGGDDGDRGATTGELSDLLDLIHRAWGGVVFEEFPGALEEDTSGAEPIDDESSAVRRALIDECPMR